MKAGRELDEQVARIVFNRTPPPDHVFSPPHAGCITCRKFADVWSSRIGEAWQVVEKLTEEWCDFSLEKSGLNWTATSAIATATADSPELAICICALESFKQLRQAEQKTVGE